MTTQHWSEVNHEEVVRLLEAASWRRVRVQIAREREGERPFGWREIAYAIGQDLVRPRDHIGSLEVTPAGEEYRMQHLFNKVPSGIFRQCLLVLTNGDRVPCSSYDESEDILRWYEPKGVKWDAWVLLIETLEGIVEYTAWDMDQFDAERPSRGCTLYRGQCRGCKREMWDWSPGVGLRAECYDCWSEREAKYTDYDY